MKARPAENSHSHTPCLPSSHPHFFSPSQQQKPQLRRQSISIASSSPRKAAPFGFFSRWWVALFDPPSPIPLLFVRYVREIAFHFLGFLSFFPRRFLSFSCHGTIKGLSLGSNRPLRSINQRPVSSSCCSAIAPPWSLLSCYGEKRHLFWGFSLPRVS